MQRMWLMADLDLAGLKFALEPCLMCSQVMLMLPTHKSLELGYALKAPGASWGSFKNINT